MLRDSIENAGTDIAARRLTEARTEAQRILGATEKVLGQLRRGQLAITSAKLKEINVGDVIDALYALRRSVNAEDAAQIIHHQELLERATEPLAHEIMNASIAEALEGKLIEQV